MIHLGVLKLRRNFEPQTSCKNSDGFWERLVATTEKVQGGISQSLGEVQGPEQAGGSGRRRGLPGGAASWGAGLPVFFVPCFLEEVVVLVVVVVVVLFFLCLVVWAAKLL